jgi:hypothetical protein
MPLGGTDGWVDGRAGRGRGTGRGLGVSVRAGSGVGEPASCVGRTVYTPRRWDTTPRARAINGADPCPTSGWPLGTAHCPAAISVCMQACLCAHTTCPSQLFRWPLVSPWSASMSVCAAARHTLRALRLPQPLPQPLPGRLSPPPPSFPFRRTLHSFCSVGLARPCTLWVHLDPAHRTPAWPVRSPPFLRRVCCTPHATFHSIRSVWVMRLGAIPPSFAVYASGLRLGLLPRSA